MIKSPYKTIFLYDFETGGMNPQLNAITELGLVVIDFKSLQIVEEVSWLVEPYDKVYEIAALEKTNLSIEKLSEEGVPLSEAFDQFMEYVEEFTQERCYPTLAGHNIDGFDNAFMKVLLEEHSQRWDRTFNQNTTLDTLKLAKLCWTELPNYQLETVCSELGIELTESHRALNDCRANALVLIEILKKLRTNRKET